MDKKMLRNRTKKMRSELTAEYCGRADGAITAAVLGSREFADAELIFCYLSVRGEPATDEIIAAAIRQGKRVCAPVSFAGGRMNFRLLGCPDNVREGRYGIREPREDMPEVNEEPDLIIVPCVCAGADGSRLGHGGGYYDRYLQGRKTKKICLCYDALMSSEIAMTDYDVYMDLVISENGISRRNENVVF